ncbi:hypothetical protein OAJ23_01095 [Pelagibacteraceae bacterium]|nr:hypothetical protein [Pelagibacteraceae bacterium]
MPKNIALFGATGSIGSSVLKLLDKAEDEYSLKVITCNNDIDKLVNISNRYKCDNLGIAKLDDTKDFTEALSSKNIIYGIENFVEFINDEIDIYILAISGLTSANLILKIAETGKILAIANKENIISLGKILMNKCKKFNTNIFPLDSEHNAIHQLLETNSKTIKDIIITASGGPFLNLDLAKFESVTPDQAINHPKWKMGPKISVDSSNMMNKSLELIEAKNLFNLQYKEINAIIHPQAIVHAILNYYDNSSYAFFSQPNMEISISSLFFPNKNIKSNDYDLDLTKLSSLDFSEIDCQRFPSFKLGKYVMQIDGIAPHIFNYVNDKLVNLFLLKRIKYTNIVYYNERIIELFFKSHQNIDEPNLDDINEASDWVNQHLKEIVNK